MTTPDTYKYTESHEWIDAASEPARVGITDHAQNELSDVVFVELPEVGRKVKAGEAVAVVESVKAASDIYAPVAGEVVEVNEALNNDPALVNQSAFSDGWLFALKGVSSDETDKLMDANKYNKHIQS